MPVPGTLFGTFTVAWPIVIPAVVVVNNWLVAVARPFWNVTSTFAPVVVSLVATTTEFGVPDGGEVLPTWRHAGSRPSECCSARSRRSC